MSETLEPAAPSAAEPAVDASGEPAARTLPASGRRPRVAVVFGGRSGEHTISCATAAGVLFAIDRERYEVVPIGITMEGKWVLVDDDPAALELRDGAPPVRITAEGMGRGELAMRLGGGAPVALTQAGPSVLEAIDVVLPLLHGPYGEDGTIQGMLEMLGLPYAGCGVLASAAGMDKQVAKVLLADAGIATAPHVVVGPHAWRRDPEAILAACQELSYPLFVKPARAGSSLGITRVEAPERLRAAIEAAREVDPKVLVESGIEGREIEVAVLGGRGDDAPRVAEPGEIAMDAARGAGEFYDYETKYLAHDAVAMVCPAPIAPQERELLMITAARAFEAIGAEGLARVDFFLTPDGRAIVNEVNTMPGFTPFSMYPYMWRKSGMTYPELVTELIELALARPADVNR
ncbi:D-alanine--D-alanine ligase [Actinomyces denticolens]|uniref:D-alanine--D-alanine ligase family protein n=1 Tax=Actinomyces denticolens TaxID=52767 RepID=UPI0009CB8224|nr:D-alanine--D-alanine ligase family protein [Actinomyces denticolens]GAV93751.1 D-alanine--D-alanine ligase [Actinomyces denticolens]SUU03080.1 D-alanine--D-alanine ligase [Actinomyces denticolens]